MIEITEGLLTNATIRDLEKIREWMLANGFELDPIDAPFKKVTSGVEDEFYDAGFYASYIPKDKLDRVKKLLKSDLITIGIKPYKHRKVLVVVFKDHQGSLHYTADEVIDEIRRYYKI